MVLIRRTSLLGNGHIRPRRSSSWKATLKSWWNCGWIWVVMSTKSRGVLWEHSFGIENFSHYPSCLLTSLCNLSTWYDDQMSSFPFLCNEPLLCAVLIHQSVRPVQFNLVTNVFRTSSLFQIAAMCQPNFTELGRAIYTYQFRCTSSSKIPLLIVQPMLVPSLFGTLIFLGVF